MELTNKSLRVLMAFMDNPTADLAGSDLMKLMVVASGTLYPLLRRFENEGLLTAEWEDVDEAVVKRPRRKMYRITAAGQNLVQSTARELQQMGAFAWAR